jgi:hypothetical protein
MLINAKTRCNFARASTRRRKKKSFIRLAPDLHQSVFLLSAETNLIEIL